MHILKKDVIIDKYHNGFVVLPKGTIVSLVGLRDSMYLCKTDLIIDIEQPKLFLVGADELELV